MKLELNIPDSQVEQIQRFLFIYGSKEDGTSHGALSMQKLAEMLMEDVYHSMDRPGSWEGTNMAQVLQAHGYF